MVGVGGQALWGQASGDGLSTLASLHSDSFLIPFQQIVATNVPPEDQDGSGDDSDNFSGSGAGEQQEAVTPRRQQAVGQDGGQAAPLAGPEWGCRGRRMGFELPGENMYWRGGTVVGSADRRGLLLSSRLTGQPLEACLTSPSLCFLICQMGMIILTP